MSQCQNGCLIFIETGCMDGGREHNFLVLENYLCFMFAENHIEVTVMGPCSGSVNINVVVLQRILINKGINLWLGFVLPFQQI